MPLKIKHTFHSPKEDSSDPTIVRPSNWNDDHEITGSGVLLAGTIIDFIGVSWPAAFLECFGQSVSAATYPLLFSAMVKQFTVTFVLGTPGTVNWASHGIPVNGKVRFRVSGAGALPDQLAQNVDYYVTAAGYSANTFQVAGAIGDPSLALTGGSGLYTGIHAPYGASTDLTSFSIPDLRGRVTAGLDIMGGVDADRLTGIAGSVNGAVLGAVGGVEAYALVLADMPAHSHTVDPPSTGVAVTVNSDGAHTHTVTGTISEVPAHTHPWTGSVSLSATGPGGAHSHTYSGRVVAETQDHTHYIPALGGYTDFQGLHTHTQNRSGSGSGGVTVTRSGNTDGQLANISDAGSHQHGVATYANNTGGRSAAHDHAYSGTTVAVADHTHTVSGTVTGAIQPGGAYTPIFSSGAAASNGAHTHTASGTVDITPFATGNAGSGGGHNNVQPTLIVRKLIFVG